MSALAIIVGLMAAAAFGEMLWRKLVAEPRAAKAGRKAVDELRSLRRASQLWDSQTTPGGV